jgi:hypothetical protein
MLKMQDLVEELSFLIDNASKVRYDVFNNEPSLFRENMPLQWCRGAISGCLFCFIPKLHVGHSVFGDFFIINIEG